MKLKKGGRGETRGGRANELKDELAELDILFLEHGRDIHA